MHVFTSGEGYKYEYLDNGMSHDVILYHPSPCIFHTPIIKSHVRPGGNLKLYLTHAAKTQVCQP